MNDGRRGLAVRARGGGVPGRGWGCRRCRLGLAALVLLFFLLARLAAGALHVDRAAEVCALGNGNAWRGDVAVDRPVVADVYLLGGGHVTGDLAENDDSLGKNLGLDPAVGADRQDVLAQFDFAFNLAFDGQVFAAVEFTLDDDGFADVHGRFLQSS